VEDDDILADDGELAHVAEQVQPRATHQHRTHFIHRALQIFYRNYKKNQD